MNAEKWPELGCGVGLRTEHYEHVLREWPEMDWFEAITENYMDSGGRPLHILEQVRSRYPVGLHGVSLSIGSANSFHQNYLKRLKALVERIDPAIVSDHLCWTGAKERQLYDLLPLPFTEEAVGHISRRIEEVQNYLQRKILIENVSTYVTYKHSVMPEWEFLAAVAEKSGCGILLDLNNVYVNAVNHGFDPHEFIRRIPAGYVGQFHLAGHTQRGDFLFDTHNRPVIDPVWDLYREALHLYGSVTTLIEWDADIPAFSVLSQEAQKAKTYYAQCKTQKRNFEPVPEIETRKFSKAQTGPGDFSLAEFQKKMMDVIIPVKDEALRDIAEVFSEHEDNLDRLAVYQEGYVARYVESMEESFPAIRHILGHDVFCGLVSDYAKKYPSQNPNLNSAGASFCDFLKVSPEAKPWPFLPDLARFEWGVMQAFHAFEKKPLPASVLSSVSLEGLADAKIFFQPSVHLIASAWPVLDIWHSRKNPVKEISIDLVNRPQTVLIFRQELDVHCELIETTQYEVFSRLLNGQTLGEIFEEIAETVSDPSAITHAFASWIQKGLITEYRLQKTAEPLPKAP